MPQKRRTLLDIPGRSTAFIQEDGGYNARQESIVCSFAQQTLPDVSLQRQVRLIAGWLSGIGELTFDYEPEMHYNAFLSSAPPGVKHLQYAQFTLDFTINHPFAYEDAISISRTSLPSSGGSSIIINAEGTVSTPVRIIIRPRSGSLRTISITRHTTNV